MCCWNLAGKLGAVGPSTVAVRPYTARLDLKSAVSATGGLHYVFDSRHWHHHGGFVAAPRDPLVVAVRGHGLAAHHALQGEPPTGESIFNYARPCGTAEQTQRRPGVIDDLRASLPLTSPITRAWRTRCGASGRRSGPPRRRRQVSTLVPEPAMNLALDRTIGVRLAVAAGNNRRIAGAPEALTLIVQAVP